MRTREKSKAQLVKELAATKELVQDRDGQIRVLREDNAKLGELRAAYEKCCAERTDAERKLRAKEEDIADMEREIRGWERSFKQMQERMKQMRKNFYHQAALAGELADNAYATVSPVNTDSDR